MKVTITNVTFKSGAAALRVETSEFDQQMVNWLRKWGNWNQERKCWYIKEDIEKFPAQIAIFVKKWWGASGIVDVK